MIDLDETLREHATHWGQTEEPAPDLGAAIARIPPRGGHVPRLLAVAATVLAVGIAATIWTTRSTDSTPDNSPLTRVGPSAGTGPAAVADPVLSRLKAIALRAAGDNGDPSATAIQAVKTTRSAANRLGGSGIGNLRDVSVWLLQEQGAFTCHSCSVPPGQSAPTGSALTLVVDATTYAGLDFGLDTRVLDLSRLGDVIDLSGSTAVPPSLLAKLLGMKGLDSAEIVLTTWPELHALVHTELALGAEAVWFVQASGTFPDPAFGPGPTSSDQTASTQQFVYPIDSSGLVAAKPKLSTVGGPRDELGALGTVLTIQP